METPRKPRFILLFLTLAVLLLVIPPVQGFVTVEYFHQAGCVNCERTDPIILRIQQQYGDRITVDTLDLDNRASLRLILTYGVSEIPVVVIDRRVVLTNLEITEESLKREIDDSENGTGINNSSHYRSARAYGNYPAVIFFWFLGLLNGLSPCLLGGFFIMIATLAGRAGDGKTGRYYPLVFGAGLVTAYLVFAAVLITLGIGLRLDPGVLTLVTGLAGIVSIIAGLVQVGVLRLPALVNPHVGTLVSRVHSLPGAYTLGIIFAILFAPCASAPFLILIDTMLAGNAAEPVLLLIAFGAGILTPYVSFSLLQNSMPSGSLVRHACTLQKIGGLILIGLGIWLLATIVTPVIA
jgi:cytochrome c-type biogenesis protein